MSLCWGSDGTHGQGKQWVMRDYSWDCQSRQLGHREGASIEEGKGKEVYTLNEASIQPAGGIAR